MAAPGSGRRVHPAVFAGLAMLAIAALVLAVALLPPAPPPLSGDPPILAGRQLWGPCAGGFHARRGTTIVVTSTGHCAAPGTVAHDPDGNGVRGVFGPPARDATCPHPGHECAASDMAVLELAPDRIPWGRLNQLDFGHGGIRTIAPGTRPLACDDVAVGDAVEINGRERYRTGTVLEIGENLHDDDPVYFPCMIAAGIPVDVGDSGGAVLVNGLPAGVSSRSFGGNLGFTPLAEGLAQLGLELCTTPDCDLEPPLSSP
jgi:hypothetical protein